MTGYLEFDDGRRVALRDDRREMLLGRVATCDIQIDDTKASRKHARLIYEGAVLEIEDLGSSNGTLLNDKPIQRKMVRDGDVIRIGKTQMTFVESAAADEAPARPVEPQASPVRAAPEPNTPEPSTPEPAPKPEPAAAPDPLGGVDLLDDDFFDDDFDDVPAVAPRIDLAAPTAEPPGSPPPADVPLDAPLPPTPPEGGGPARIPPAGGAKSKARSTPSPRPKPQPAPPKAPDPFDDDFVQLAPKRPAGDAKSKPGAADAPKVERGVLQFSKHARKSGVLGDDISQTGGLARVVLVLVGVVFVAGVAWLAMHFARG